MIDTDTSGDRDCVTYFVNVSSKAWHRKSQLKVLDGWAHRYLVWDVSPVMTGRDRASDQTCSSRCSLLLLPPRCSRLR